MTEAAPFLGYGDVQSFLVNLVRKRRLPTAILLTGPPMIGKATLLQHVARFLLCAQDSFCGACASCSLPLDAHPDVLQFIPVEETELKAAVAALFRRLHERPVASPRLVVFIEVIDRLSPAALALFLKAIEDAPRFVHFLLTAESVERVPETVRSRALVRTLAPLSTPELVAELTHAGLPLETAKVHGELASGRTGLARRFETDTALKEKYLDWHRTIQRLGTLSVGERGSVAAALDDREEAAEFLHVLQGVIRDTVRAHSERIQELRPLRTLLRRSREATAMLHANVPPRLVLEYVFFTPHLSTMRPEVATAGPQARWSKGAGFTAHSPL